MSENREEFKIVTTGVAEESYKFEWKIENFMRVHNDETLRESQKFEIETGSKSSLRTRWVVGLKTRPDQPFYHVYSKLLEISSLTDATPVSSTISVQLLRKSDNTIFWDAQYQGRLDVNEGFDLDNRHWWGPLTNFEGFLDTNGTLTMYIKLSLLKPFSVNEEEDVEQRFQKNSNTIVKRNLQSFRESVKRDVKIICRDGKEVGCHGQILKCNSPVFRSMLSSGLAETKTGTIKVEDISADGMEVIINYLYSGELLPNWSDPNVIVEVTYAAAKYQLVELLKYLDETLGSDNHLNREGESFVFPALLDLANKLSLTKAEKLLKQKIVEQVNSAKSTEEILSMFQDGCAALNRLQIGEIKQIVQQTKTNI